LTKPLLCWSLLDGLYFIGAVIGFYFIGRYVVKLLKRIP
jgi:hypothetical protein